MALKVEIDIEKIASEFKKFELELTQELTEAVAGLAAMTHAKVIEDADQELKSTRELFKDNCKFEQLGPSLWSITILEPAMFIEDGIDKDFDMKPGMLKNGKTGVNGNRYKIIPFDHAKAPSRMGGYAKQVSKEIRAKLKKENVNFKKIELNADGSPKLGKLHSFDFGGDIPGKGNTPVMQGVSIYQSAKGGNVRRDILTFRTVSSGPKSDGKWIHPGLKGKDFLTAAQKWALNEWENSILPPILEKWRA